MASLLFAKTAVADETSESEAIAEMPSYMYRTDILYCIVEEVRRANGEQLRAQLLHTVRCPSARRLRDVLLVRRAAVESINSNTH